MSTPPSATWLRLTQTNAPAATILIRLYVGLIFLCEGTLKFLRPETLGAGRFDKAGIPVPTFLANLDGTLETVCGILLLAGLATRVAAAPMIVNMAGALLITKAPIQWGNAALFSKASGWWDFIHESRTDLAQLCGATFLLLAGAGAYSLDAAINRRAAATSS